MATKAMEVPRPSARLGRLIMPLGVVASALVIWGSLGFLRDPQAPQRLLITLYEAIGLSGEAEALRLYGLNPVAAKLMLAAVALTVGVGAVWLLFIGANAAVDRLRGRWRDRLRPYVFVGPALLMLSVYLVFPSVTTIVASFTEGDGVGANYARLAADPATWIAVRNNLLWLVLGTGGSVALGLLIATLVDRVKREALAKTFIFLPMAISMVGAAVIWRFVYAWQPPGQPQIGLLNAGWTALGNDPVPWLQKAPTNTLALIVIMVWLQTGFAMVVLSAAIKGLSTEVIEAARMDGASEAQLFFRVVVPMIRGSILTVATTIAIAVLKVFDIVFVTTGGRFETDVIANRMFTEFFRYRNFGPAAALAVVLFVAVLPIIVINVRNLRRQGISA
jgi:alpha-glucoside transport system permease protein